MVVGNNSLSSQDIVRLVNMAVDSEDLELAQLLIDSNVGISLLKKKAIRALAQNVVILLDENGLMTQDDWDEYELTLIDANSY